MGILGRGAWLCELVSARHRQSPGVRDFGVVRSLVRMDRDVAQSLRWSRLPGPALGNPERTVPRQYAVCASRQELQSIRHATRRVATVVADKPPAAMRAPARTARITEGRAMPRVTRRVRACRPAATQGLAMAASLPLHAPMQTPITAPARLRPCRGNQRRPALAPGSGSPTANRPQPRRRRPRPFIAAAAPLQMPRPQRRRSRAAASPCIARDAAVKRRPTRPIPCARTAAAASAGSAPGASRE